MISIDTKEPAKLFENHINKKDNKNIVFSAPFGYGKTYFLDEFFKEKKNLYNVFWLSPVKYVVGQNEDIFEYIKIDISLQLIAQNFVKKKTKTAFSEGLFLNEYLSERPVEIAKILFESVKDLDIPIVKQGVQLILNGIKAKEVYDAWKTQLKKTQKEEIDIFFEYISTNTNIKGSIFEEDVITKLIRLVLLAIKYKEENFEHSEVNNRKENVLIIDDLDRLDPEHIFRILNIFSAHQNFLKDEDKFGFDKIIIVCHIRNIKNIYVHKFGENVDFNGYMEKFYSTDIFHFDNQSTISLYCRQNFGAELNDGLIRILGTFLSHFVRKNLISIRSIMKYERTSPIKSFIIDKFLIPEIALKADDKMTRYKGEYGHTSYSKAVWGDGFKNPVRSGTKSFTISSDDFPIIKILQILVVIFGDYENLKKNLEESKNDKIYFDKELLPYFVTAFMPFVHFIVNDGVEKNIFANFKDKAVTVEPYGFTENTSIIDYPSNNILDTEVIINVGWNEHNQYSEELSYYSLTKLGCTFKDEKVCMSKMEDQLINFIFIMIKYLEKCHYLRFIGVPK